MSEPKRREWDLVIDGGYPTWEERREEYRQLAEELNREIDDPSIQEIIYRFFETRARAESV